VFFFFQAEDGIRDKLVTGVQTCALPISKIALVEFVCGEGVFHPRLTNLFEAFAVIGATAHSIEILRNDRVISIWQCEPIDRLVRSEERRVGKEWRSWVAAVVGKKKK